MPTKVTDWKKVLEYLEPKESPYCPEEPSLTQRVFLRTNALEALFGGAAGGGKSSALLMAALQYPLAVDTLVPTTNGWRTIETITVGDQVFDETGTPREVRAKTDRFVGDCYEIEFGNGERIVADASHLWAVHSFRDRMAEGNKQWPSMRPLHVLSTAEIAGSLLTDHARPKTNWSVPAIGEIDLPEADLPVDPYLLGVWLGDGSHSSGTIAGIDPEVKQAFIDAGYKVKTYSAHQFHVGGWVGQIRALGLYRNKRVPEEYLRGSAKQRLALLQGLMDTDGTVNQHGACRFFNTNEHLVEAVEEIVGSLGANARRGTQRYTTPAGEAKVGHHVDWSSPFVAFRLERKAQKQILRRPRERTIRSVAKVIDRDVQCLVVDGPSHLFAVGRSFLLTHNCDVPDYSAILFRRTFADLALPGALMDRAREWFSHHDDIHWNANSYVATFPSGARISFGYLNNVNDYLRYKGAEFQFIGMDEVTEIREADYRYLFSRLRRPASGPLSRVPLRMRSASNPAPNWVRQRFIVEGHDTGRIFVPSLLTDNPGVDAASYRQALQALDPLERRRLEEGDWWATTLGSLFDRAAFVPIDALEVPVVTSRARAVRFWDCAATEAGSSNPDPDWTVGTLMLLDEGIAYVLDVRRMRGRSEKVERLIAETAAEDGHSVAVRMEQEPGSAGKAILDQYARYVLPGYDFAGIRATGDKLTRARPFAAAVANGNVRVVRGPWLTEWLDELSSFPEATTHDDQVDSAVGAFTYLTGLGLPQRKRAAILI